VVVNNNTIWSSRLFGLKKLSVQEVKDTCKLGKRMALGTTQEVGISTTYFANPFGPQLL